MREVYSNCTVALAAEDTADCDVGFLPRLLPEARDKTLDTDHQDQTMRTWSGEWGRPTSGHNALSTRGWTLQERILPSRTLRFTSYGMSCECNRFLSLAGNLGLLPLTFWAYRLAISGREDRRPPEGADTIIDEADDGKDISHRHITNFLVSGSPKAMYYAWYSIAENYSSRTLTEAADKLSALSGLARLFAGSVPNGSDDYLAGIWRQGLAEGLLWHAEEPCARIPTYTAPSWSWASMAGKISYLRERNQFPFESDVEIEESVCDKSLLDPTGSVSGGYIRLVGQVVPVHLLVLNSFSTKVPEEDSKTPMKGSYVSKYLGGPGHFGRAYKDQICFVYPLDLSEKSHWEVLCDERMPFTTECRLECHSAQGCECNVKSENETRYFCLSVGRMIQHPRGWYDPPILRVRHWWLLLEAMPSSEHAYKRIGIGYFHRNRPNIFNFADIQTVELV